MPAIRVVGGAEAAVRSEPLFTEPRGRRVARTFTVWAKMIA